MIRLTLFLNVDNHAILGLSVVSVIKHSPELKTDFEFSRSKVEICLKSQQAFASQTH